MLTTWALLVLVSIVPPGMAPVGPGTWRSPVEKEARSVPVARYLLDVRPVTNEQYLAFVRRDRRWLRGSVPRLLADAGYLSGWKGPLELAAVDPRAPVTWVSWFAARAYCQSQGKRLATTAEWELAAEGADAASILAWYAQTAPSRLGPVGGPPNRLGIRDLHGLVWEWVEDFGSAMIGADARAPGEFCGAGGASARDPSDYASFMRFAFRGSLEGTHTIAALGFRCAKDLP